MHWPQIGVMHWPYSQGTYVVYACPNKAVATPEVDVSPTAVMFVRQCSSAISKELLVFGTIQLFPGADHTTKAVEKWKDLISAGSCWEAAQHPDVFCKRRIKQRTSINLQNCRGAKFLSAFCFGSFLKPLATAMA